MKKFIKIMGIILVVVILGLYGGYTYLHYESVESIRYESEIVDKGEYFEVGQGDIGFVFYSGGMVSPDAYLKLADELAQDGLHVFVVKPLLDLAILDQNNIENIMNTHPEISKWYVGGHSLGGTVAMMDVINNELQVEGVFFLGSYPIDMDKVEASQIPLVSILGANDLVVNQENYQEFKDTLLVDEYIIEGGNHSGFGTYGLQRKDGKATISNDEQIKETVNIIIHRIFPGRAKLEEVYRQAMQEQWFASMGEIFKVDEPKVVEFNLLAVGDLVIHTPIVNHAWNGTSYDFTESFKHVKPLIESADFALCTLETALAGADRLFTGYPSFNGPDEIADALSYAGFDAVNLASNHINDRGFDGYMRTTSLIEEKGMAVLGGQTASNDQPYIVVEKDGVKIGIISYTYETNEYNGHVTINGVPISHEFAEIINTFNYQDLDNDLQAMTHVVKMMSQVTDAQVFVVHWGNEYHQSENMYQKYIGETMTEAGIDLILGSHPHVIQPIDWITTENGKALVFYAMGNFLSNQAVETLGNPFTTSEDGTINDVTLTFEDNILTGIAYEVEPTWVNRFAYKDGRMTYEILPVEDTLENLDESDLSAHVKSRLKKSYNNYLNIKNQSSLIKIWVKDI